MVGNDRHRFKSRLKELRNSCWDMSVGLTSLATDIRMGEFRQLPVIEERLQNLYRQFETLRHDLEHLSRSHEGQTDAGPLTSLPALESCLQNLNQALQAEALQVINQVLTIIHIDNATFPPLNTCLTAAEELRREIESVPLPDLHPAVGDLVAGVHPLAVFLTLVRERQDLPEEEIAGMQDSIVGTFGNLVFIAALMGKLHIPGEERASGTREAGGAEAAADTSDAEAESKTADGDEFQEQRKILQDLIMMTRMKIDKIIRSGVAREKDMSEYVAAVQELGSDPSGKIDYHEDLRKLHAIRAALDDLETKAFSLRRDSVRPDESPRRVSR